MLRPNVRRVFVGLIVVGLLAMAAPARASGLRLEGAFHVQDLWSQAWSWLAGFWSGADGAEAAVPGGYEKDSPPGPPPAPPRPRPPNHFNGGPGGGDGSGADPDG